ncbi:LOW QUALITY PROTEIN: hypothetical protein JCM19045_1155 [Bacillus sp. JCM 19045]|nr:LOW QUALITY PROTEIN: hypothetical protein JCM19045_1155 [Bacillus sp. JCM 19045]
MINIRKVKKIIVAMFIVTVFISTVLIIKEYQEMKRDLQATHEELDHLYKSMRNDIETIPVATTAFQFDENHQVWADSMNVANDLHLDSNGYFKKEWGLYLGHLASDKEINPYLVYELLKVESGETFDTDAIGPDTQYGNAYGMAQFMTNTAHGLLRRQGLNTKRNLLFDPYYAIQLSIEYLDFLYGEYGNWSEALTAYNRGMGGLQQYINQNGHANSEYASTIKEKAAQHQNAAFAYDVD